MIQKLNSQTVSMGNVFREGKYMEFRETWMRTYQTLLENTVWEFYIFCKLLANKNSVRQL